MIPGINLFSHLTTGKPLKGYVPYAYFVPPYKTKSVWLF